MTLRVYVSETQLPKIKKVGQQVNVKIDTENRNEILSEQSPGLHLQFTPEIIQTKEGSESVYK
jgi:multidrug resistance efflux pump